VCQCAADPYSRNLPTGQICRRIFARDGSNDEVYVQLEKFLRLYFTYLPSSPLGQIDIKFCTRGRLADVINRAKFYFNRVRHFDSVGVEF